MEVGELVVEVFEAGRDKGLTGFLGVKEGLEGWVGGEWVVNAKGKRRVVKIFSCFRLTFALSWLFFNFNLAI